MEDAYILMTNSFLLNYVIAKLFQSYSYIWPNIFLFNYFKMSLFNPIQYLTYFDMYNNLITRLNYYNN